MLLIFPRQLNTTLNKGNGGIGVIFRKYFFKLGVPCSNVTHCMFEGGNKTFSTCIKAFEL